MMKRICTVIIFYLMVTVNAAVAQAAIIDLSQSILLEGSALNLGVIIHESKNAFFTIDLVDNEGKLLQNNVISPAEGVNSYALTVPVDIPEQVWLVIRNGDQTQLHELLVLPRPEQLLELDNVSEDNSNIENTIPEHKQTEKICFSDYQDPLVYLSSSAEVFNGCLLQFDELKDYVHYPVEVESIQINQAFVFDVSTLKSMQMKQAKNKTVLKLEDTHAGSVLFAVNKLTNLPEKLEFTISLPTTKSIFTDLDIYNRKWLANQLLIHEVVTPLNDKCFSAQLNHIVNSNWQAELGTATINLKPQNYVAFDDMKSFLTSLARNLRIYAAGEGHSSYVYPIQKKASLRQPLYLIDGQIAVLDDLLALSQEDILSIQVYTEIQSLIQTLGPVASAGLIIAKSSSNNKISKKTIGQMLVPLTDSQLEGPLSPLVYRGISSQNCYEHNMRLGVFNVNALSIEGKTLKIHSKQINIIPLSN